MKLRVVIEEVVVDAEFGEPLTMDGVEKAMKDMTTEALRLHEARQKVAHPGGREKEGE